MKFVLTLNFDCFLIAAVEVWLQYINLCLSNMSGGDVDGVSKCRDVFERAISACGLNVAMGSLIWDTYRDFEFALMSTFATEEEIEAQEKRYIALCKRQLSVPLLDMKHTYEQLAEKIDLDENTEIAYKKAVDRLEALEEWEAKLVSSSCSHLVIVCFFLNCGLITCSLSSI